MRIVLVARIDRREIRSDHVCPVIYNALQVKRRLSTRGDMFQPPHWLGTQTNPEIPSSLSWSITGISNECTFSRFWK
jgi:hypothetical protein